MDENFGVNVIRLIGIIVLTISFLCIICSLFISGEDVVLVIIAASSGAVGGVMFFGFAEIIRFFQLNTDIQEEMAADDDTAADKTEE